MNNRGDLMYYNPEDNIKTVFIGKKYRITVLTPRLVRLEYSEDGKFVDENTELVVSRSFGIPEITSKEDNNFLEIKSKYFFLSYEKEKKFGNKKLSIKAEGTDNYWYYGSPEVKNLPGAGISIEDFDGKVKLKKGLYSFGGISSIDDSENLIYDSLTNTFIPRKSKGIDIYVFIYNKDFNLCLNDYFTLTGYPPLIPRYALGNWWCKDEEYSQEKIIQDINEFKSNQIPLSVLILDNKWRKKITDKKNNDYYLGYTFDYNLISNPKKMIDDIHSAGIRLGLAIRPQDEITNLEENYNLLKDNISNVSDKIKYDANSSEFLNVFYNKFIKSLEDLGTDFFFIDYLPTEKNINELFMMKHYQFSQVQNKRPMLLARNALIAGHRYPVLYSGRTNVKFENLKIIPYYNISSTNIGISWWSHDIGGYYGGIEESENYVRAVQLGVFSPILRFHAGPGKYVKREPWRWDIKTYTIVKEYLNLRNKLVPYLYTEAYKYSNQGIPLIIPLYYKYQEAYDDLHYKNEYYFGTELFVSPLYDKQESIMNRTIHRFYMPDGIWYDFITGKKYPGGRKYISFYKIEDYPVFAKAGAIVPLSNSDGINNPNQLEIQVFPGRSNSYNMYEDDGYTNSYLDDNYLLSSIDYTCGDNNCSVIVKPISGKKGIVPDYRDYKIVFRNMKSPDSVVVHSKDVEVKSNNYAKNNDFIVEVKKVDPLNQLTVTCRGKDLEIEAMRLINDDIDSILMDLPIDTSIKELISRIMFTDDYDVNKKRVEIRKLKRYGVESIYIKLFLRLLEYINQI